jgi:hypothetical protein
MTDHIPLLGDEHTVTRYAVYGWEWRGQTGWRQVTAAMMTMARALGRLAEVRADHPDAPPDHFRAVKIERITRITEIP